MEEELKQKSEIVESVAPQKPVQNQAQSPVQNQVQPGAAPQTDGPLSPADNPDPYGLNAANAMLANPKVKKYMGRMSKIMVGFAILGCFVMIAAVTAITTLFNMIVPK